MQTQPLSTQPIFTAEYPKVFPKHMEPRLVEKIATVAFAILTLGTSLIVQAGIRFIARRAFMSAAYIPKNLKKKFNDRREKFLKDHPDEVEEVRFKTPDKAALHGILVSPPGKEKKGERKFEKCIIFYVGMGGVYEHLLKNDAPIHYAKEANASILFFNPRGVMLSSGFPQTGKQAVIDGDAAFQYVKSLGFKEENIILHGHSLGAIISSQVAYMHKRVSHLNEKSAASLSLAVSALKGAFLGILSKLAGWHLPAHKVWEEPRVGKRLIVVHKKDFMMPFKISSLYRFICRMGYNKEKKIEIAEDLHTINLVHKEFGKTKAYMESYTGTKEVTTHSTMLIRGSKAIRTLGRIVNENI